MKPANDNNETLENALKTQKLKRWPIKKLKKTDLLLPADLRAILIGAPCSGEV